MPCADWNHVHLVGCGGVGMAGLAHILLDLGVAVSGTDAADSEMLRSLCRRSSAFGVGGDERLLPEGVDLLVYSAAVPESDAERRQAVARGITPCCRGEFLACLAGLFPRVAAVAGSHGKTTVTAMLAHMARCAGLQPGYLVGGSVNGWERSAAAGSGQLLITEVDESDGTQALLSAAPALVINIDDDHCWSHGGVANLERCFYDFAARSGQVLAWDSPNTRRVLGALPQVTFVGESALPVAGQLPLPGHHNRVNAAMALQAAAVLGISPAVALAALADYPGVSRRLSVRWRDGAAGRILLEDYAHHPEELRATLAALREGWPGRPLLVVFQPHRYERVRRYAVEFSRILAEADQVWVVAPFAAWRQDQDLADAADIAAGVNRLCPGKAVYLGNVPEEMASAVAPSWQDSQNGLLAVIGAGDVSRVVALLAAAG